MQPGAFQDGIEPSGRRPRRRGAAIARAVLVAALLLSTASAAAQDEVPTGEFSVQRFTPAPGANNYFAVDGARLEGHLTPQAGLVLDYAHEPLVVVPCRSEDDCDFGQKEAALVKNLFTAHLLGAVTLFERIQIGLNLPLVYSAGESFELTRGSGESVDRIRVGGGSQFSVGDPRLSVKGNIYDMGPEGLELGAVAYTTAPLGQAIAGGQYIGDGSPVVGGHFVGEFVHPQGIRVAANVGGLWRKKETLFSTQVGPQLTYGVAADYQITPLVSVLGEVTGAATFRTEIDENPLEGRIGGQLRHQDFVFTLAAGAGMVSGVGSPMFRVLGGASWQPDRSDSDGDGVLDSDDACPSEPEDLDGFEDRDGCPDPDNDGDGILDGDDRCPNEPEDVDGFEDEDGCPDPDNDGDGITDGYDSCPDEPENKNGFQDSDGCPERPDRDGDGIPDDEDACPHEPEDTDGFCDLDGCPEEDCDGDGILDVEDECPDEPETFNGFEDDDGCPEPDGDGDGIPDAADQCPDEAETFNGNEDGDGCPDGEAAARMRDDHIELLSPIEFRGAGRGWLPPRSNQALDAVAALLELHPRVGPVRVEVHTDDGGSDAKNVQLAEQRAAAIIEYLGEQGVGADRLKAVGIGAGQPKDDAPSNRVELPFEPSRSGGGDATAAAGDGGEAAEPGQSQ